MNSYCPFFIFVFSTNGLTIEISVNLFVVHFKGLDIEIICKLSYRPLVIYELSNSNKMPGYHSFMKTKGCFYK